MTNLKRAAIAAGISSLIVVGGALPALAATLDPPKAWVCKYVGTGGVDERLQTGNNPILVDRKSGDVIGSPFTDAQGRSIIIAWGYPGDNSQNSPNRKTIEDCSTPSTTTTTTTTRTTTKTTTTSKPPTRTPEPTHPTSTWPTHSESTRPTHSESDRPHDPETTTWTPRGVPGKTGVEDEVPVLPFAGLGALAVAGASLVALRRRGH